MVFDNCLIRVLQEKLVNYIIYMLKTSFIFTTIESFIKSIKNRIEENQKQEMAMKQFIKDTANRRGMQWS